MKKRYLIHSAFTLWFTILSALLTAQPEADSLYALWLDDTKTDSVRTYAMRDLINTKYLYSTSDSAIILAEQIVAFGEERDFALAQALGLHMEGLAWHVRGNYPKALKCYQESIEIGRANNDVLGVSKAMNNIGIIYSNKGAYTKALEYHLQSLAIKEKLEDQKGIANSLNSVGNIYALQGNSTKALEYFLRSLKIAEALKDDYLIAGYLNNIGFTYERNGDPEQALEYFSKSLELNKAIDSKQGIALSLGNVGNVKVVLEQYEEALQALTESLRINESLGDQKGIANIYNNIGTIHQIRKEYPKALRYCAKGYELSKTLGLLKHMKDGCACLYEVHKTLGNGLQALEYLESLKDIDDSLAMEETAKSLQQMEFQNEMLLDSIEQAEEAIRVQLAHEVALQKEEKTRNLVSGAGLIFLLLAGGFFSRWRYVRKSKATLQIEKDRSENLLLNILPEEVARELKENGRAAARNFERVSILFTDFKNFTAQSAHLSATELLSEINHCFEAFDGIMEKYGIEKIKTIGDAYMAAGGLPVPDENSVKNTVMAAIEMQEFISRRKQEMDLAGRPAFEMRAGIHTGPVVAGIVGVKKFQYDIWGDTVNTASRMESSGDIGQVNISQTTFDFICHDPDFVFTSRGKVKVKGKGELEMHFVRLKTG